LQAEPYDSEKDLELNAFINQYGNGDLGYWIGLSDLQQDNVFIWDSTGEELEGGVNSDLWGDSPPQPDSAGGNCVCKYDVMIGKATRNY